MKNIILTSLTLVTIFLSSCEQKYKPEQLKGAWQAVYVKHGDEVVSPAILKGMGFEFNIDKTYNYAASANDVEQGNYWIEGDLLFTEGENVMKKAVKIETLTADSLVLGMNDKGASMTMIFIKE